MFRNSDQFQKRKQQKKRFQNFAKFQYRFHSPQAKYNIISSKRNFIKELPYEFQNDFV